jgi:hypothetical protein
MFRGWGYKGFLVEVMVVDFLWSRSVYGSRGVSAQTLQ